MKLLLSEVFENASKLKTKKERVDYLRKNQTNPALRDIIRINYDDAIQCLLPEGAPPYEKDDAPKGKELTRLEKKYRQFKFFFNGPTGRAVGTIKRERMFIQLLESLHASEAEMLVLAKDKKMKYTGITKKLCQDAFPGLITK